MTSWLNDLEQLLIYAHDVDAGRKREVASALWLARTGVLSTQVLHEFYVDVTRKIRSPVSKAEARAVVGTYIPWCVEPETGDVNEAFRIEDEAGISFWDALQPSAGYMALLKASVQVCYGDGASRTAAETRLQASLERQPPTLVGEFDEAAEFARWTTVALELALQPPSDWWRIAWLANRSSLTDARERRLVDLTSGSWNLVAIWLRQISNLVPTS